MRTRRIGKIVAGVLAVGLFAAACSSSTDSSTSTGASTQPSSTAPQAVGLNEGAPALVQTLTDQLDSHVYLAAIAISTGLSAGLDSPEFTAAATTLDTNSQDLAASIASVYGADAGDQFLALWRKHIGFFVDYTAAKAGGDTKAADKALSALDNYRQDFGAFIDSATGGKLPADAVAESLQMHVNSLVSAIDAAVAGDPAVFDLIYEAATMHMPGTASALAGGISAQMPDEFPGSVESPGSVLQQTLTNQLDSHVYLAAIAISTGLSAGLDSPEFTAAATTLDTNSQDLAASIASVYGADAGDQFLALWRKHIGFFVDYTAAKAGGDTKAADKALSALDNYRQDFGAFIDSATGGKLPADAVAESLQMHVNSLVSAIDAAVAGDPAVFDLIYEAATMHMPGTASALAGGISAQMPDEFPTT
ncbi:MAG: copper amine oxidase [Actinomycetota bacterium]